MTLLTPTTETTRVHGYMKIISMSKARNSIVIAYQRTWNRLTACSAGGMPPVNGAAVSGDRVTPASHDTPYTTPYTSAISASSAAAAVNPDIQPPSFPHVRADRTGRASHTPTGYR